MADVCELAHARTVRECRRLDIKVDCESVLMCDDEDRHGFEDDDETHYTSKAQVVFDRHYDHIIEVTGL